MEQHEMNTELRTSKNLIESTNAMEWQSKWSANIEKRSNNNLDNIVSSQRQIINAKLFGMSVEMLSQLAMQKKQQSYKRNGTHSYHVAGSENEHKNNNSCSKSVAHKICEANLYFAITGFSFWFSLILDCSS